MIRNSTVKFACTTHSINWISVVSEWSKRNEMSTFRNTKKKNYLIICLTAKNGMISLKVCETNFLLHIKEGQTKYVYVMASMENKRHTVKRKVIINKIYLLMMWSLQNTNEKNTKIVATNQIKMLKNFNAKKLMICLMTNKNVNE